MRSAKTKARIEDIALTLARARVQLLAALDEDIEDVDLTVTDHGDAFGIRVEGRNCVSVWNQTIDPSRNRKPAVP